MQDARLPLPESATDEKIPSRSPGVDPSGARGFLYRMYYHGIVRTIARCQALPVYYGIHVLFMYTENMEKHTSFREIICC